MSSRAGRRQPLEVAAQLVAEHADGAALERGEVRSARLGKRASSARSASNGSPGRGRPSTVVRPPRLSSTWNGSTAMNEWRPASSGVAPSSSTAWGSSANGAKSAAGSA